MKRRLTFQEIRDTWLIATENDSGKMLTERTFLRYRISLELEMYVTINCDRRNGNRYFITDKNEIANNKLLSWVLSVYRYSELAKQLPRRKYILVDEAPPSTELLDIIVDVIEERKELRFQYKSHYKDSKLVRFLPHFVRLCQNRWYVIGVNLDVNKERIYAFERISDLRVSDSSQRTTLFKDLRMDPSTYFSDYFGVVREGAPEVVKIRVYWPQNAYLKDVPLHHSQHLIFENENFCDFELYVSPTFDFIQALLSNREMIEVLEPLHLRDELKDLLTKMLSMYINN